VVDRRAFLRFLLASPLLAAPRVGAAVERLIAQVAVDEYSAAEMGDLIAAAEEAINVFDFRAVAERNLSQAHYDYLAQGVEHEVTLRANREGFAAYQLRPRRLVDTRDVDLATEIAGTTLSSPIVLSPCGSQKAFHPEGELAVARAARRKDHLQLLSTGSSTPLEEVVAARGAPIWFQLYASRFWPVTRWLLKQAEDAGCPAVVLTVDTVGIGENRDRIRRHQRVDNPACQPCHGTFDKLFDGFGRAARVFGVDARELVSDMLVLDWDFVDRIRDTTDMKLWIKGILTGEDASLCLEHGVDGIVVSNHGGRAEDVGLSTIEVLPEIVAAVGGRVPILVDSGFRRGTDLFKALALGADAVCVGRPYLWGLASFGQEGVETVLGILRRELEMAMKAMGTPSVASITPAHVRAAAPGS
jgi:isopentenyl diphosphate isomerase/L-lactate dehydrogenase-like FMN-dependent dehydrogenase